MTDGTPSQHYPVVAPYQPFGEQQQQQLNAPQHMPQYMPQENFGQHQVQQPLYLPQSNFNNQYYSHNPQPSHVYPQAPAAGSPAELTQAVTLPGRPLRARFFKWVSNYETAFSTIAVAIFIHLIFNTPPAVFLTVAGFFVLTCGFRFLHESVFFSNNKPLYWFNGLVFLVFALLSHTLFPKAILINLILIVWAGIYSAIVYKGCFAHSNAKLARFYTAAILSSTVMICCLYLLVGRSPLGLRLIFAAMWGVHTLVLFCKHITIVKQMESEQSVLPTEHNIPTDAQLGAEQQELFNSIQQILDQQRMNQSQVVQQ
ncbi:DNA helicase [Acrasis kona]|uniref:DNA helicase n=1 Tax=Acrasis kona TaxID=1008807 RepID=A0AAW2YYY6_9EUKA